MMYSNRFIASVRTGGKILRENQGVVTLPFGAEYELLLKNLNSRRAMVKVSIDGVDVTGGTRLIIRPNDTISLERFIKDGNFHSGNRLKFIERTGGVESHRGIKQDDGLIRCEFWAEKEKPQEIHQTIVRNHYVDHYTWPWYPYPYPRPIWTLGGSLSGTVDSSLGDSQSFTYGGAQGGGDIPGSQVTVNSQMNAAMNMAQQTTQTSMPPSPRPSFTPSRGRMGGPSASAGKRAPIQAKAMRSLNPQASSQRKMKAFVEQERSLNDAGITVPGSESHQQFWADAGFPVEDTSSVIVLQLRGEVGGVAVVSPVTVDLKPTCSSCGKKNKPNTKYCSDCGTALFSI